MKIERPAESKHRSETNEALSNKKWEVYYSNVKKSMPGTESEKETILRKRILKFFQDYKLDTHLNYVKRRDVQRNLIDLGSISVNYLLLYGVDFMSEERIRAYFYPFQVQIQLYDDSHCSVRFADSQILMQALFSLLLQRPPSLAQLYNFFQQNHGEMVKWKQVKGYTEMLFERSLWARFLTKDDIENKVQNISRQTVSAFELAKDKFLDKIERNHYQHKRKEGLESRPQRQDNRFRKKNGLQSIKNHNYCEQRLNKFAKLLTCSHTSNKRYRNASYSAEDCSRGRERSRQKRKKQKAFQLKAINCLAKPLPIIEEITNLPSTKPDTKSTIEEMLKNCSTFEKRAIPHVKDESEDSLYDQMMNEFSKYNPFDGDVSSFGQVKSLNVSRQSQSFFECDSGDEKQS